MAIRVPDDLGPDRHLVRGRARDAGARGRALDRPVTLHVVELGLTLWLLGMAACAVCLIGVGMSDRPRWRGAMWCSMAVAAAGFLTMAVTIVHAATSHH